MRSAMTPATYSACEKLRDGRPIEIRALRPDDKADMLAAIDRTAVESLRRRFFVSKRGFSEKEKDFFLNVDFVNHVALVAAIDEDGQRTIVGGGRYIVTEPGKAEVAFRDRCLSGARDRSEADAALGEFGTGNWP